MPVPAAGEFEQYQVNAVSPAGAEHGAKLISVRPYARFDLFRSPLLQDSAVLNLNTSNERSGSSEQGTSVQNHRREFNKTQRVHQLSEVQFPQRANSNERSE